MLAHCAQSARTAKLARRASASMARVKKVTKERAVSCHFTPRVSLLRGFFDTPSMAWSKNGAHPCAPPSGSTNQRLCKPRSDKAKELKKALAVFRCLALGSWLLALGSWLFALGSWLLALGSSLLALRSSLFALGLSLLAFDLRLSRGLVAEGWAVQNRPRRSTRHGRRVLFDTTGMSVEKSRTVHGPVAQRRARSSGESFLLVIFSLFAPAALTPSGSASPFARCARSGQARKSNSPRRAGSFTTAKLVKPLLLLWLLKLHSCTAA